MVHFEAIKQHHFYGKLQTITGKQWKINSSCSCNVIYNLSDISYISRCCETPGRISIIKARDDLQMYFLTNLTMNHANLWAGP